jgi:histidinol-phosphatase (PHP family)
MEDRRLTEYLETLRAARRRWEGRIAVFLGLEVDYIRGRIKPGDFRNLPLDFIIGSVHFVIPPGTDRPFAVDGSPEDFERLLRNYFAGDGEALMEAYWDALEGLIREGGFDVLGHTDLIRKNNPRERWFSLEGRRYRKRIEEIARRVGEAGLVAEANTGGWNRGRITDTYPSPALLRLFGEREIPLVLTADAHRVEELGGHYEDARRILMDAGYTRTVRFGGKKDGRPLWMGEPL